MELHIGRTATVEGLHLEEVIFLGSCPPGDRAAFAELRGQLGDLLRSHDPDAVLLNLLSVEEILADDLRDLANLAIAPDRPDHPRLCAIAVRRNWTLVSPDGRPVHNLETPGLLTCGPDRDAILRTLEQHLADLAAEPKGRRPIYFPVATLHPEPMLHAFLAGWFSNYLWRMQEPSLAELSRKPDYHGYRFLWLRTFHEPVSVRLEIGPDGAGILTAKKTSGQGGYFPGRLVIDQIRDLPTKTVSTFLVQLAKARFWTADEVRERSGFDGSEWVLEGAKGGLYYLARKWCPGEGGFRDAALFLLGHSGIDPGPIY